MGSIPIARSINPDDSVDLTRLSSLNSTKNRLVLDGSWTVIDSIGRSISVAQMVPCAKAQDRPGFASMNSHTDLVVYRFTVKLCWAFSAWSGSWIDSPRVEMDRSFLKVVGLNLAMSDHDRLVFLRHCTRSIDNSNVVENEDWRVYSHESCDVTRLLGLRDCYRRDNKRRQ